MDKENNNQECAKFRGISLEIPPTQNSAKIPNVNFPVWINFTTPPNSPKIIVHVPDDLPDPSMEEEKKSSLGKLLWQNRGIFLAILSSLTFSTTAVLVKRLKDYDHVNIALWRFVGVIIPSIPLVIRRSRQEYLRRKGLPDKIKSEERVWWSKRSFFLLMLRSILSCNALLLHFWSLNYISAGDAIVVFSCSPAFAYGLAYFMLGEPCGIIPMATSALSLLGVGIIQRPPFLTGQKAFDQTTLIGTAIALACALLSTVSFITLRRSRYVPYSITTMAYGLWGGFENLVIVLIMGTFALPRTPEDWGIAFILAALAFLGQIAIVLALKVEQTGPVSLIRTFDVIFGFIFQSLLTKSFPDMYSLIGAGIVTFGILITGLRKWLMTLPEDEPLRKVFWILLRAATRKCKEEGGAVNQLVLMSESNYSSPIFNLYAARRVIPKPIIKGSRKAAIVLTAGSGKLTRPRTSAYYFCKNLIYNLVFKCIK